MKMNRNIHHINSFSEYIKGGSANAKVLLSQIRTFLLVLTIGLDKPKMIK